MQIESAIRAEQYTFNDLIKNVLDRANEPLTAEEIWEKAQEFGFAKKLGSTGKTPWATVGARLYTEIKENQADSLFVQVSKRPSKFALRKQGFNQGQIEKIIEKQEREREKKDAKTGFHERDLHQLLVNFAYTDPRFRLYTKTIFHENSSKKSKGMNEWLHPDIVGVYFPFDQYCEATRSLQTCMSVSSIKLYAFELKIGLSFSNLRQAYFQAVSNSSWANEGYLVCLHIDDDPDFISELQRLTNSFGIGIIQLNPESVDESKVIFSAKPKDVVDWDTVNRLVEESKDFKEFISGVNEDIAIGKVKSGYDPVLLPEKIKGYILQKGIK